MTAAGIGAEDQAVTADQTEAWAQFALLMGRGWTLLDDEDQAEVLELTGVLFPSKPSNVRLHVVVSVEDEPEGSTLRMRLVGVDDSGS